MQTFFHILLGFVIKILLYTIMTVLMVNVVYILSFPFHYLSTSQGTKLYSKEGQVFDIESNSYHTITLGDKEWTSENLRTSKFNDGRSIFHAKNIQEWDSANKYNIPAWTNYNFDELMDKKYGKIYNYAVMLDSVGVAPTGWSIPTIRNYYEFLNSNKIHADITTKEKYIPTKTDGSNDAEFLRSHLYPWTFDCERLYSLERYYPIDKGTNETGFSALPGGYILAGQESTFFTSENTNSGWWAKNKNAMIILDHEEVFLGNYQFNPGFYIRLIK